MEFWLKNSTSKMPSTKRTNSNVFTPAFAAKGVNKVSTEVTAIPAPKTWIKNMKNIDSKDD